MRAVFPATALALAFCLALVLPVRAFVVPPRPGTVQALMDCSDQKTYDARSSDAPAAIAASFAGKGASLAFRTCRDTDRNVHYFLREHLPGRNGVCRSLEKEIFPGGAMDSVWVDVRLSPPEWYFLKGWKQYPPNAWQALHYPVRTQEFGFVTDGDCPPGDDARYLALINVTDGMLKSFQQVWARVAATPQSLKAAIAPLPVSAAPTERFNTPERQQAFRTALVARMFEKHERPAGLACDSAGCSATFDSFRVLFDVTPDGIVLTGLAAVFRA